MKRIKKVLLVLIGVLCLTGCNSKEEVKTLDYDTVFNNLKESYVGYEKQDKDIIEGSYAVDLSSFNSYMVVLSNTATSKMYAIFELGSDKETSKYEAEYFITRYSDYWKTQGEMYSPEDLELIKNGTKYEYGNYIIYIVNEDPDSIFKIIKK